MFGLPRTDFYLRGAYGPSNLGDDILMMICAAVIKQHHPHQKLLISVENPDNARKFLPGFDFVRLEEPVRARVAVLGGGGQFFSFKRSSQTPQRSLFKAVRTMRPVTLAKRMYIEALHGKGAAFSSQKLIGLSLGVGPFENGVQDYQYQRTQTYLRKMDYLTVRDAMSEQLCRDNFGVQAKRYTDLSFSRKHWLGSAPEAQLPRNLVKIGIVVRDWKNDGAPKQIIDQFIERILQVKAAHEVVFISLDRANDRDLMARHQEREWLVWDPETQSPRAFLSKIQDECAFLFSMRAHGVLLPAAINIPSIVVEIEPKLRNVHDMLPNGTKLLGPNDFPFLAQIIQEFSQNLESYKAKLADDFAKQEDMANSMINDFASWTHQHA